MGNIGKEKTTEVFDLNSDASQENNVEECCILFMDSLDMHNSKEIRVVMEQ